MAKIEIISRDVKGFGVFGAQHLFVIFTDSNDIKTIIRGGPKHGHEFKDDLHIIKSLYEEKYKDLFPNDVIAGNPSALIFKGSDIGMQVYMDQMWDKAEEINAGSYDYKFPTPGCSPSLCHVQNSNTAVRVMIEATDLNIELPLVNGKEIWAPGLDGEFKHSIIDEGIEKINDALDVLGSFSSSDIRNPEIDNGQRFKLLSQKAKEGGDTKLEELYTNLAAQQDSFISIFGEVENNDPDIA